MNSKVVAAVLLLCVTLQRANSQSGCDLKGKQNDKDFPDLFKEGKLSYQLSVVYTPTGASQTDYFKEYYDILNKIGRVDSNAAGKTTRYYYLEESNEAFLVTGGQCQSYNLTDNLPDFMKEMPTDWLYQNEGQPIVRGPSAMFRYGLSAWTTKTATSMAYMGVQGKYIRGLPTQMWRRCVPIVNLVADYYFTTEDHEDAFGTDFLKAIPLRVVYQSADGKTKDETYPQTYDIISFQPFVSDEETALKVPSGVGCRRSSDVRSSVDMPSFEDTNLFFYGEAVYLNKIDINEEWNYYSTFMFALDVSTNHLAYKYSPWVSQIVDDDDTPGYLDIVFDMENKYVYSYDMDTGNCNITRQKEYYPRYYFPKNAGYLDLTDPILLYPNDEFQYIAEGMHRGYEVHEFEATFYDLNLGTRVVPKVIVTRKYLKDNTVERSIVAVKDALASIQLKLFDKKGDLDHSNLLTVNFYGFSTQLQYKQHIFKIMGCMKNDDYLWVTMGFPADQKTMDKMKYEVENIQNNLMEVITVESQLNALRLPMIFVTFRDVVNVFMLILNKPPIRLDYDMGTKGKTISGTKEAEGVSEFADCATSCLETEDSCWAFSICGASCYYGTGAANEKITDDAACTLYKRFDNGSYIPSNLMVSTSLRRMVETKQMRLAVPDDDNDKPIFIEASYIEIRSSEERDELFQMMRQQLNPRFRVRKVGAKLVKGGESVKSLGTLRYDECQRICLDYQICETMSYCLKTSDCVLSATDGDSLAEGDMANDNFCNVLTRKYTDNFKRQSGEVLSQTALKSIQVPDLESCSKACMKETGFACLSFDYCPASKKDPCRLHAVHYLDAKKGEKGVTQDKVCGHYSKKYSYSFKSERQRKSVGTGLLVADNLTSEECAKMCLEYNEKPCYGYDFCEDGSFTSTACNLLLDDPSNFKTSYSPICTHYLQTIMAAPGAYSTGTAAWVGIVCFVVAALFGVLLTFGIAYYRANKSS